MSEDLEGGLRALGGEDGGTHSSSSLIPGIRQQATGQA